MSNCPRYADSEQCEHGAQDNKTCAHCDHNAKGYTPSQLPTTEIPQITNKADKVKAAMDTILKIFEQDNLEVVTRAVFTAPAGYEKPCDKWSFMNRIFMMLNETEDARGYKQWQAVGRNVTKGSHAFSIFGPLMHKVKDEKTGENKTILTGFKAIPVFRYEDTEGEQLPDMPKLNLEIPCQFDSIIKELQLTVKAMAFHGDYYGYYAIGRQTIVCCTPEIKTFLHELSHAVDDKLHGLKGGQHNDQEVTAEFSAAVVGHLMGYKIPYGNCKQYIEGYSFRELMHQLNRCEKVIKFIVDRTTANIEPIISPAPSISLMQEV